MKISATTIEEFFTQPGEKEADLRAIDRINQEASPELKRQLLTGPGITMLGYGEMSWKNKSSSGVRPLISMAPQKGHISLYVAAEKDGILLPTLCRQMLGKTSNGKNRIRFRRLADISQSELRNAIHDAILWSKEQ